MQDLKRSKKRVMNQQMAQMQNKLNEDIDMVKEQEVNEELSRGCNSKPKHENNCNNSCNNSCNNQGNNNCHHGCGCNSNTEEFDCVCVCKKPQQCEPCEPESKECVDNVSQCGSGCCNPITSPNFSPANSVPYAIEANRIFDTMAFQTFTDAVAPNGEALIFDYDVVEVNGPIPRSSQVNVTIDKVCMNYSGIVIDAGVTTLEDFDIQALEPVVGKPCETNFEYVVCGEKNSECCKKGKGTSVVYKQRGLNVTVEDLVLELRGKCGCTTFVAYAYPAVRGMGGQIKRCCDVEFIYNTLSAPICMPSDGRGVTLRQDYQTNLTVDCIGKALLRFVDHDGCECYYDLCVPNGIDLILCLQCTVSTLINEQIVVLGAPNAIRPRIVDTFNKVCDFTTCPGTQGNNNNNNNNGCGCSR